MATMHIEEEARFKIIYEEIEGSRKSIEQTMLTVQNTMEKIKRNYNDHGLIEKIDAMKPVLEQYVKLLQECSDMFKAGLRAVCENCIQPYIEGDKYCRFCGAPMGKPEYIEDDMQCIYGPPPVERTHICSKCGYSWKTHKMIDNERWCPKCGGEAPCKMAVQDIEKFFL